MSRTNTVDHPVVDVNIPRFNQAVVATLTALGFVWQRPVFVALAFAMLLASRLGGPRFGPLTLLYVRAVRPLIDPDGPSKLEDARPPAFSQWIGVAVTGAALLAFLAGLPAVGWALTAIVAVLAALAATAQICVGCLFYERFLA